MSEQSASVSFVVLGVAAPQGSFRAAVSRRTGKAFLLQSCKRTMPWRQEVAAMAQQAMALHEHTSPFVGPVRLQLDFYLPRPAGHRGKRGLLPSAPTRPAKKPDLSKLVRAIEDALTSIVYLDDAQVVEIRATKSFADDEVPGADVRVETVR